jgi:hypothetical protein
MSWTCFSSVALLDLECRKKAIFIDSFVDNLDIEKHAPLQEAWILVI